MRAGNGVLLSAAIYVVVIVCGFAVAFSGCLGQGEQGGWNALAVLMVLSFPGLAIIYFVAGPSAANPFFGILLNLVLIFCLGSGLGAALRFARSRKRPSNSN